MLSLRHIQVYAPCNVVNKTLLQALTSWPFCVFPGQVDNTKLSVPCEEIACKVNVYQCSVCQGSEVLEFNLLTNGPGCRLFYNIVRLFC